MRKLNLNRIAIAITITFGALTLVGCNGEAETVQQTGDFRVGRLFTIDGCTAYRFNDGGRNVYFTNCPGVTDQEYRIGKSTHQRQASTSRSGYTEEVDSGFREEARSNDY